MLRAETLQYHGLKILLKITNFSEFETKKARERIPWCSKHKPNYYRSCGSRLQVAGSVWISFGFPEGLTQRQPFTVETVA